LGPAPNDNSSNRIGANQLVALWNLGCREAEREYECVICKRSIYKKIEYPGKQDFLQLVETDPRGNLLAIFGRSAHAFSCFGEPNNFRTAKSAMYLRASPWSAPAWRRFGLHSAPESSGA
jgi:hypothetical protein